jgi:hypothetical protein
MAREARPRYLSLVGLALAIAATGQARRGPFVRHDTCARAIASATNEYQKLDQNQRERLYGPAVAAARRLRAISALK